MKKFLAALLLTASASGSALAACAHEGIYYEHGTVLCFQGYLQECTVADYWSAIGMCNAADPKPQIADRLPDEQTLIAMAMADKAAEKARQPIRR